MTNHPNTQCSHDAEEETHMQWLEENGFPAMRQLLADQGCDEGAVLRSLPTGETLGVFHTVSTHDGEAQARDGQAFYALNPVDSEGPEPIAEIEFGDGLWMLVAERDLNFDGS